MSAIKKIGKGIGHIEDWLTIAAFLLMMVVVVVIVLCRYVFKIPFMQGEEIARYLMIWCAYSGTAYGFRKHSHVGVEVFAGMLPKSWQPHVKTIRDILSCLVVIGLFIFSIMCLNQYIVSGQMTTATKIPRWTVYIIIPIALLFSILHTLADVIHDFSHSKEDEVKEADKEVQ